MAIVTSDFIRRRRISALILLLALVKNPLYSFSENILAVFFGTPHSEGLFAGFCSVVFVFNIIVFLVMRPRLTFRLWMIVIVSCGWGLIGLLQSYFHGMTNAPFFFFIFSFDVIIWTCVVCTERCYDVFAYYFGVFVFWYGWASVLTTFGSLLITGQVRSVGVNSYQGASYNSAFTFGMIWFYYLKSGWFREKFKYAWCLLPLLFVATVLPGGRGAFILLFVYTVWCIAIILHRKKRIRLKNTIKPGTLVISIVAFAIVLYFLFTNINDYMDVLEGGFRRAISYFDFQTMSLDFEGGSSGRGSIYEYSLEKIGERPLTGYGIYGYLYIGLDPYPHNIILEILLQYGVILGFFFLAILFIFEVRLIKKGEFLQLGISFYVYVNLMFSGSYTSNPYFWFILCFALAEMFSNNESRNAHIILHRGRNGWLADMTQNSETRG